MFQKISVQFPHFIPYVFCIKSILVNMFVVSMHYISILSVSQSLFILWYNRVHGSRGRGGK